MKCIGIHVPTSVLQNDMRAETYIRAVNFADKMGFQLKTPEDFKRAKGMFALLNNQAYHAKRVAALQVQLDTEQRLFEKANDVLNARVEQLKKEQEKST